MNFIEWYLSVGAAIYTIFFIKDALRGFQNFRDEDIRLRDVIRGLCVIFVWPILPWIVED